MIRNALSAGVLCLILLSAATPGQQASPQGPLETVSLLGRKLYALNDDPQIASVQRKLVADPSNANLALQLSKAQAARRQYREAIATCTSAPKTASRDANLYLERGHRELGLREFKAAQKDLQLATELNPKLLEAHYHLGLAQYFLRDFAAAAAAFDQALALAQNPDDTIDCSNWAYVSHRRAGQTARAEQILQHITPDLKNREPHLYFYLRLLRFYQGALTKTELLPAQPSGPTDIEGELSFNTISYGVGNWYLYNKNDPDRAREFFRQVVQGNAWNSWGFIGSELELAETDHPR